MTETALCFDLSGSPLLDGYRVTTRGTAPFMSTEAERLRLHAEALRCSAAQLELEAGVIEDLEDED